jgi:hypothetical protein
LSFLRGKEDRCELKAKGRKDKTQISNTNDAEHHKRRAGRNKVSQKEKRNAQVAAFELKNNQLLIRPVDTGWAKPITFISRTR